MGFGFPIQIQSKNPTFFGFEPLGITVEKIKIILDLITFLSNDSMAENNVKSLETLITNNDLICQNHIHNIQNGKNNCCDNSQNEQNI